MLLNNICNDVQVVFHLKVFEDCDGKVYVIVCLCSGGDGLIA